MMKLTTDKKYEQVIRFNEAEKNLSTPSYRDTCTLDVERHGEPEYAKYGLLLTVRNRYGARDWQSQTIQLNRVQAAKLAEVLKFWAASADPTAELPVPVGPWQGAWGRLHEDA